MECSSHRRCGSCSGRRLASTATPRPTPTTWIADVNEYKNRVLRTNGLEGRARLRRVGGCPSDGGVSGRPLWGAGERFASPLTPPSSPPAHHRATLTG